MRPAWRYAIAVPVAAGLAAGVLVAAAPGQPAAHLLADRATTAAGAAARAAQDGPAIPAGQWIYEQTEFLSPGRPGQSGHKPFVQDGWMTADGRITDGAGVIGAVIVPYDKLGSLPASPAALDKYLRSLDPVASDNTSSVEFSTIMQLMMSMVLPPSLQAEMYHALALISGVQVHQDVKDIAGRTGVAFVLPPTKQSEQLELILDASDYHLLAQASWDTPGDQATLSETAILKEYPVAQLGSTQPSSTPPSAAELLGERFAYDQEWGIDQSTPRSVTPGQWLYRELSTGGKSQQIWATADDSAQAGYVNGTLQVCQRTAACAASEQWLMPAGPSYTLVYPQYPRLSAAELKKLRTEPAKKRLAELRKLRGQRENPPTLPQYPGPLLAKLSTYRTGCTDVAGDCDAVNVAASVLTGYGDYPSLDYSWFLALAEVPGVGVQSSGPDLAFTFPAQDGVTQILFNAGTLRYAGYVRDGQQTLVQRQAVVSGPGVRP
jgi:hypothetical protein